MPVQYTPKIIDRFWSKVDRSGGPDACWPWLGAKLKDGYGAFTLPPKRSIGAHRAIWVLLYGEPPAEMKVCHNCPTGDNPACVNPAHLWLGTQQQNIDDKMAKGREARGERHGRTKLTEDQAREIRQRYAAGEGPRSIGRLFGIHRDTAHNIATGKTWPHLNHIPGALPPVISCGADPFGPPVTGEGAEGIPRGG
jgi:hypothetical protein